MTPLPDEQPLSRRQLREQQRPTETGAPTEPHSRRASTTSPVTGGEIPDVHVAPAEPALTTDQVAVLEAAAAEGRPLTRRQARDLERVRTASLSVVTQPEPVEGSDGPGASDAAVPAGQAPEDRVADVHEAPEIVPATQKKSAPARKPAAKKSSKGPQTAAAPNRMPSFVPSSAPVAEPEVIDAELVTGADAAPSPSHSAYELLTSPHPESAFGPAATAQAARRDDTVGPQLATNFGQGVLSREPAPATPAVDEPFDQIIARGLEEAGSGVSTSSIILPALPNSNPLTGPLSANGSVVVTGSIDLPSGMGSTGGNPDHFDKSDIDAMFDAEDEARPPTAGTPVSASKAVSTHTATRDVITPPAPARSNRLLLILAITAGVLAVAVLSVIIVGIAAGAFQP